MSGNGISEAMTLVEEQLGTAIDALKKIACATLNKEALAALNVSVRGVESMRPYAGVGLKVRPSEATVEALNSLRREAVLSDEQWASVMHTLRMAHETERPLAGSPVRRSMSLPMHVVRRGSENTGLEPRSRRRHGGR